MFQYDMLARSLASGNGFRWYAPADLARLAPFLHINAAAVELDPRGMLTTFRAPLYPAFLALVYAVNGVNDGRFFAARLAQAILGALLAPLTYLIAGHLSPENEDEGGKAKGEGGKKKEERGKTFAGENVMRLAAWFVAAYPMLLIFPLALATENLFFLLVLASVLALLKLAEYRHSSDLKYSNPNSRLTTLFSLLSGFLLGLAALTRSVILPFAGLSVLWIWLTLKKPREAVLTALALAVTVAPWIMRNSLVTGKPTGIETSMGYNLYVGYHPQSSGTFTFGPSLDLLSILDDKVRDEVGSQRAIEFIKQDPARFPYLALRRLGYFFNLELRAFTYFYVNDFLGHLPTPALLLILLLLASPFAIISLSGAFGAARLARGPETILLGLLFTGYLLPHVFILSEERFHLTLTPFFAALAANFWTGGFTVPKSRGNLILACAAATALLLVVNWCLQLAGDWRVLAEMLGPNGNQLYLPY